MKTKIIVIFTLTLLMLFAAVAPVWASQPKTQYRFGAIGLNIPNTGTTFTSADKIEHATNTEGISFDSGHPWGLGFSTAVFSYQLKIDQSSPQYLTGNGIYLIKTTYSTGTLELDGVFKFEGLNPYTYQGPTFTATLPVYGSVTVNHGATYYGLILTGTNEGHGVFTDGNIKVMETFAQVLILAGPLAGISITSGTGTTMTTGNP